MDKIAIIDSRADDETVYSLENVGIKVIPTMKIEKLYDAIATHADIQIHYLGNNRFVCAPEVYDHYRKLLSPVFELIIGCEEIGDKYPYDVRYNVTALKKFLICNTRYTSSTILSKYECSTCKILNVKQGYSKCNICIVDGNAIITSDKGILKTAKKNSIDVLEIQPGHIHLSDDIYGFIGGATGIVADKILAVNGDINTHPNSDAIKKFCKHNNVEIFKLKDALLRDIGSIITNAMNF